MAKHSVVVKIATGSSNQFSVSFTGGFIERDHVSVRVNNEVDGAGAPSYRTITWISDGILLAGGALAVAGAEVVFTRTTPILTAINDYVDGTVLSEASLDLSFEQLVNSAQEQDDRLSTVGTEAVVASEAAATALILTEQSARIAGDSAHSEGSYFGGFWDASGGAFPNARVQGGAAQNGDYFKVSDGGAGTVNGVAFTAGQRIVALVDGPSTTTYAENWYKDSVIAALAPIEAIQTADAYPVATFAAIATLASTDVGIGRVVRDTATGNRFVRVAAGGDTAGDGITFADLQNRTALAFSHWASQPVGTFFTLEGLDYAVKTGGTAATDAGVANIAPVGLVYAEHYGLVAGLSSDQTAKAQQMLDGSSHVIFRDGSFVMDSDLLFNSNQIIEVREGAVITCNGGRITPKALGVDNVTIICDGEISSVGLVGGTTATTPRKFDWVELTSPDDSQQYAARGFIEFGGSKADRGTGFKVVGKGVIHGDWTGTVGDHFAWSQYPLKGIMANSCDDVLFDGIEVYGFVLEAVQHYDTNVGGTVVSKNIIFQNMYVHDTAFSGLNFNHANEAENCFIRNNVVKRCRHGIEISSGDSSGNVVHETALHCYSLGGGGRVDRVTSTNDTAIDSGDWAVLAFASESNAGVGKLTINNVTVDGAQRGGITGGRMDIVINSGNIENYGLENAGFLYEAVNIDDTPSGTSLNKTLTVKNVAAASDGASVNTANVFYTDCPFPIMQANTFSQSGKSTYLGRSTGFKALAVSPQTEYLELPFPNAVNIGPSTTATMRVQPTVAAPKSDYARIQYFLGEYQFTDLKARGGIALQTKKGSLDDALGTTLTLDYDGNVIMQAGNFIVGKGGTTSTTARGTFINTTGQIYNAQPNGGNAQTFLNSSNGATIGTIAHSSTSVAYNTTSDERLKDDLTQFDGLALVKLIDVYDYQWIGTDERSLGVMAQELHKLVPTAVTAGGADPVTDPWVVDYSKLVPILLDAVKRLEARVHALERGV